MNDHSWQAGFHSFVIRQETMIPSNILNIFTNTEPSDISYKEECLTCQIMGSATCLVAGAYFMSNLPFSGSNTSVKRNPIWWKNSVKGAGAIIFALGILRGGEGWLWNQEKYLTNESK